MFTAPWGQTKNAIEINNKRERFPEVGPTATVQPDTEVGTSADTTTTDGVRHEKQNILRSDV
ncbi:hypothetical protein GCM10009661_21860 [Catellatospora chokoriensis]|uniref:Uncharacterized protein n=1 Tax=Catellatospora chokoriensis TaxID=310353 RepID=A0A8J3NRF0_9ACTN|nr:hypothetical protein Cch02nite_27670 [Catellatospora chokoriensis]